MKTIHSASRTTVGPAVLKAGAEELQDRIRERAFDMRQVLEERGYSLVNKFGDDVMQYTKWISKTGNHNHLVVQIDPTTSSLTCFVECSTGTFTETERILEHVFATNLEVKTFLKAA